MKPYGSKTQSRNNTIIIPGLIIERTPKVWRNNITLDFKIFLFEILFLKKFSIQKIMIEIRQTLQEIKNTSCIKIISGNSKP